MARGAAGLFVYGSLLSGEENHGRLLGAALLGPARTQGGFALWDLGPWPAVVRDRAAGPVLGELYALDGLDLAALDRFEGVPSLFRRAVIDLAAPAGGAALRAFAYVLPRARLSAWRDAGRPASRLPSGDWRARRAQTARAPVRSR